MKKRNWSIGKRRPLFDIVQTGDNNLAIQGSNSVFINGKEFSGSSIAVVNNEVYIDGFHQGDVSPLDYLTHGLLK